MFSSCPQDIQSCLQSQASNHGVFPISPAFTPSWPRLCTSLPELDAHSILFHQTIPSSPCFVLSCPYLFGRPHHPEAQPSHDCSIQMHMDCVPLLCFRWQIPNETYYHPTTLYLEYTCFTHLQNFRSMLSPASPMPADAFALHSSLTIQKTPENHSVINLQCSISTLS